MFETHVVREINLNAPLDGAMLVEDRSKLTHWRRTGALISFYSTGIAVFFKKVDILKLLCSYFHSIFVPDVGGRTR